MCVCELYSHCVAPRQAVIGHIHTHIERLMVPQLIQPEPHAFITLTSLPSAVDESEVPPTLSTTTSPLLSPSLALSSSSSSSSSSTVSVSLTLGGELGALVCRERGEG